jgi:hypothetical protein
MRQNESVASQRTRHIFLVDSFGNGVNPTFAAGDVKVKQYGAAAANITTLPTPTTGGPVGLHDLVLAQAETATAGPLAYWVEKAGVRTYADFEMVGGMANEIWNYVTESTHTAADMVRMFAARLFGKATVLTGDGSYAYRDIADSKNRIAGTISGTARSITTRDGT